MIDDTTDRNVVFFDALVEALSLVRDRKMERKILMPLEPRRLRAQRSIQLVATRVVLFVATFFVLMISALTDLAVNIYILTAGLVSDETLDTGAYANQFSVAVEQTPFGALDRALSNLFRLLSDVVVNFFCVLVSRRLLKTAQTTDKAVAVHYGQDTWSGHDLGCVSS